MYARVRNRFLTLLASLVCLPASSQEHLVAPTLSKAAIYIYSEDFIYVPVAEWFSREELSLLEQHSAEMNAMIQNALNFGDSVGGSALTVHFKLEENISLLRSRLLRPGVAYGWEGPDYDSEEDYLTDNQFVYHSVYLWAIEETSGQPVHEIVQLTQEETQELFRCLEDPEHLNYYWAKWLARELQLLESPSSVEEGE